MSNFITAFEAKSQAEQVQNQLTQAALRPLGALQELIKKATAEGHEGVSVDHLAFTDQQEVALTKLGYRLNTRRNLDTQVNEQYLMWAD